MISLLFRLEPNPFNDIFTTLFKPNHVLQHLGPTAGVAGRSRFLIQVQSYVRVSASLFLAPFGQSLRRFLISSRWPRDTFVDCNYYSTPG